MSTRRIEDATRNCMCPDPYHAFYSDSASRVAMATVKMLGLRCSRCGEYASLGPANDEPAEVQVEIRAAELAQYYADHESFVQFVSTEEMGGWFMRYLDNEYRPRRDFERRYAQSLAGYLAFEIAHGHDATHEHEGNK